jgi:hypothetical protein
MDLIYKNADIYLVRKFNKSKEQKTCRIWKSALLLVEGKSGELLGSLEQIISSQANVRFKDIRRFRD